MKKFNILLGIAFAFLIISFVYFVVAQGKVDLEEKILDVPSKCYSMTEYLKIDFSRLDNLDKVTINEIHEKVVGVLY